MPRHNYEQLLIDIKNTRHTLLHSKDQDDLVKAEKDAINVLMSEEFGNFLSLSTLYNELEKFKK